MSSAGKQEQADAYLAHLATQRKLSAHTVAAYGRDLRELATLSDGKAWDALSHFDRAVALDPALADARANRDRARAAVRK